VATQHYKGAQAVTFQFLLQTGPRLLTHTVSQSTQHYSHWTASPCSVVQLLMYCNWTLSVSWTVYILHTIKCFSSVTSACLFKVCSVNFTCICFRCIDGYSRKIMWLRASCSNHDPGLIANYFLETVSCWWISCTCAHWLWHWERNNRCNPVIRHGQ